MAEQISDYAGRQMSLEEFVNARSKIQDWAMSEFLVSDPKLYDSISHVCTLASGMWFHSKVDE